MKNKNVLFSLAAATVFGVLVAGCATYLLYAENDMPKTEAQAMPSAATDESTQKPLIIEEPMPANEPAIVEPQEASKIEEEVIPTANDVAGDIFTSKEEGKVLPTDDQVAVDTAGY